MKITSDNAGALKGIIFENWCVNSAMGLIPIINLMMRSFIPAMMTIYQKVCEKPENFDLINYL
jgi:hypothetical protein